MPKKTVVQTVKGRKIGRNNGRYSKIKKNQKPNRKKALTFRKGEHGYIFTNGEIPAMSFDDMLDTSEALTNYTRTGRTDVSGLSPYASRYVKNIMKLGTVKAEKRLSKLNRAIVDANEILSKPQGNMHRVTTANQNRMSIPSNSIK